MDAERLMNGVLRGAARGREVAEVLAAALASVEPKATVRRSLIREGSALFVNEDRFELSEGGRVFIVGAGKAGAPMTQAAFDVLGETVAGGVVIVKDGHLADAGAKVGPVELFEASHPVPDARGVAAAEKLAALLEETKDEDLVVALVSGGGSALLTLPEAGLTLEDLRVMTDALLRCGATINEVNALRKHTTRFGGGRLARLARPARIVSLIISDVVGSPLDVIASGPTAPDSTTFADAWRVVERYKLREGLPPRVVEHLQRGLAGEVEETPKAGDEELWSRVRNHVVASNVTAAEAAVAAAFERGFEATLLTSTLEGEAREVGRYAASLAREMGERATNEGRPLLAVLGGETTVTLRGGGRGGRNQELALAAALELDGAEGVLVVALATDGGDGPTDAAGAAVNGETLARARTLGYDAGEFLQRNDAYNFFAPLDALLRPGPTLTNVNDLLVIVAEPSPTS